MFSFEKPSRIFFKSLDSIQKENLGNFAWISYENEIRSRFRMLRNRERVKHLRESFWPHVTRCEKKLNILVVKSPLAFNYLYFCIVHMDCKEER